MDIEFHYYMTYLIAVRAGYSTDEAGIIAYSSQYVDDNDQQFPIGSNHYMNGLTQTMDILKPKREHFGIYPLLHFIPGHSRAPSAKRKDGRRNMLVTTPNSRNAQQIMDEAVETGNLYHIGITAHSYVDTWAHQNFIGIKGDFNGLSGFPAELIPNIGHADAQHKPDIPSLIWLDDRLIAENEWVDNTERFLQAAEGLFMRLHRAKSLQDSDYRRRKIRQQLRHDLAHAMGECTKSERKASGNRAQRINRYQELAFTNEYGKAEIPEYDKERWLNEAVNFKHPPKTPSHKRHSPEGATYFYWKDEKAYAHSHWYRFQLAANDHKNIACKVLRKYGLSQFGDPLMSQEN